jgi:hypothetical protein
LRERRGAYRDLVGKPLGKLGLDGKIILKMYLQESGRGLDLTDVTGKKDKSWSHVNTARNPRAL